MFHLNILIWLTIAFWASCSNSDFNTPSVNQNKSSDSTKIMDTVQVYTPQCLLDSLRSNRVIILMNDNYSFPPETTTANLSIDSIHNLTITGFGTSVITNNYPNNWILEISNSQSIKLNNISLKRSNSSPSTKGGLIIKNSSDITINQVDVSNAGTFGIICRNNQNTLINHLELSGCTASLFEIENCTNTTLDHCHFIDNYLWISVLGGFTYGSNTILLNQCIFKNNYPKQSGNPVFNSHQLIDTVQFKNCTFHNNPGYKWYNDNLNFIDCDIDFSDFIGIKSDY